MDRVRHEVEKLCIQHAPAAPYQVITVSVGIAELGGGAVNDWLLRADAALYQAKFLGRNRVEMEAPPVPPSSRWTGARGRF
jgi:diguanylate cyclase (GGDEF)-like protein